MIFQIVHKFSFYEMYFLFPSSSSAFSYRITEASPSFPLCLAPNQDLWQCLKSKNGKSLGKVSCREQRISQQEFSVSPPVESIPHSFFHCTNPMECVQGWGYRDA